MAMLAGLVDGVIGVDTHRDTLAAAAVTSLGGVPAHTTTTSADAAGYQRLLDFAGVQVPGRRCWAVEGAGSFGAGLATFLDQHGERVVGVGRPKRLATRSGAKSDALDAVRTRPRGLGQDRLATPDDPAGGGRCGCCLPPDAAPPWRGWPPSGELKAPVVGVPGELRAELRGRPTAALRQPASAAEQVTGAPGHHPRPAGHRPAHPGTPGRGRPAQHRAGRAGRSGRAVAVGGPRRRPRSAAQVLVSWSHAGRLRPEAALAMLAGAAPIPASSGQVTRHRPDRGGDRQPNRALHTILLVRLRTDPDTRAYLARRTAEGTGRRDATRCPRRAIARQLFRLLERYDRPGVEILRAA